MSKLNKLEMLDTLFEKLAHMPAMLAQAQQPQQQRAPGGKTCVPFLLAFSSFSHLLFLLLSAAELRTEIGELQAILFSETSSEREKEDANIKLEKVIQQYEQTAEAKEEVRKRKEDRRLRNDSLNRAALVRVKEVYNPERIRGEPELLKRVGENPELRLLFMESETILRLHQNDYKTYTMKNITLEEMRAIRALLPPWKQDQHVQREWTETLDDRIDALAAAANKPAAPKKEVKKIALPKGKPAAAGGDIFSELLARKGKPAALATAAPHLQTTASRSSQPSAPSPQLLQAPVMTASRSSQPGPSYAAPVAPPVAPPVAAPPPTAFPPPPPPPPSSEPAEFSFGAVPQEVLDGVPFSSSFFLFLLLTRSLLQV
jgi:hypothetical protein